MPITCLLLSILALLSGIGRAAADVDAGKTAFRKCVLCHAIEAGKNSKVGPSLFGVVGRKSASLENFKYSEGMKKFDHVWDEALVRLKESLPRTPPAVPVGSL